MAKDKITELQGIVRNTKDSASVDGECDEVINLRYKDKSWRPVGTLKDVEGYGMLGSEGYERLFVHTNEYRHLFGVKGGDLYWIGNLDDGSVITPFLAGVTGAAYTAPQLVKEGVSLNMRICQTGHLMVVIDDGLSYYLYRPYADKYDRVITDYNNEIDYRLLPYGNVELKVDLECCEDGRPFIFASHIDSAGIKDAWDDTDKESEVARDVIYKTQKDITALNRFWGAFLVCTAAELYDGTFILMSQPAMMLAPNVKTSEHYQGWNTDILTNRTTTIGPNGVIQWNVNRNVCEKILSRSYCFSVQTANTVAQDTRFGCTLLYSQFFVKNVSTLPFIHYPKMNNKIDYDYNKELIEDTEFEACAVDTLRLLYYDVNANAPSLSTTRGLIGAGDPNLTNHAFMINAKDEISFHTTGDFLADTTFCFHYANKLKYKITSSIPAEYRDVIKNISVFITPQAQMCDLKKIAIKNGYEENAQPFDKPEDIRHINEYKYDYRTIANITKELMEEGMFYKIGEIKTEDFTEANVGRWVDLKIEDGVLTNLLSQDRLVVESNGRNSYNAKVAFPYNNRLHIADYVEELFHGWLVDHFWYNGGVGQYDEGQYSVVSMSEDVCGWIKVTIDDNGTQKVVVREIKLPNVVQSSIFAPAGNSKQIRYLNPLLSYPDRNAKTMEIYIRHDNAAAGQNNTFHQTYTLTAHDYFNYAYYVTPDLKPIDTRLTTSEARVATPAEAHSEEAYHNRMKVSKMNNPLYFPYENVHSVGNGKIVGMAANELVLATGQVGDAPLYIFCSDGVFGFFVDSSGMLAYNFARVISEYVCNNAGGIFNIHGGVMFPTDKGYVLLEGLQARDVTDKIEGVPFFRTTSVAPYMESDIPQVLPITNNSKLVTLDTKISKDEFVEYIKNCIGGYNFSEKEIWITNKSKSYSYILDKFGIITKRTEVGVQLVNDFPRTYLLDVNTQGTTKVSTLRNLMDEERDAQQTMFLTRAIKNDTQEFKQTERLIMRGEYHLPTSEEYNVQEIDLTDVYVEAETVEVKEPTNVVTVQQQAMTEPHEIVPETIYHNYIAVYDEGSVRAIKDADQNNLDVLDNDSVFAAIEHLFRVGGVVDPNKGWVKLLSDTNAVEFSITPNALYTCGYEVRMRFTNNVVYGFTAGGMFNYRMFFFEPWEGTSDELATKLASGVNRGDFCYLKYTGVTYELNGMYRFTFNAQTRSITQQDQIPTSELDEKSNYKFAYLHIDQSNPTQVYKIEKEWFIFDMPTAAENCYDYIQAVVNGDATRFEAVKYNNVVSVVVGNNRLYLDEAKTQSVVFSATVQKASPQIDYIDVVANYNSGYYGRAVIPSATYRVPRNTYVKLYSSLGLYIKTIYYTGGGTATWLQLTGYPAVTVNSSSSTISFVNGGYYDIRIGFYEGSPAMYRTFSGVRKYIGTSGTMTLSAIYADVMSATPVKFAEVTESDHLAAHNVSLRNGVYYRVTYVSGGTDVTVEIRGTADEIITAATLVTRIGQGYYPQWEAVDKLAGLYLFGSYDNKKWALLGAREQGGDFRDLGLIAYRVDCKYFRLLFVGQLKSGSSIEYIEQVVSDRVFRGKIR